MNKPDEKKQKEYLNLFYPILVEALARAMGELERKDMVSIEIDEIANCIFGAAFTVLSHEYVRMDEEHFVDKEMFAAFTRVYKHNLKQFKDNLPSERRAYKEYLRKYKGV